MRRVLILRKDGKVQYYWVKESTLRNYQKYVYPKDRRKRVYYSPEKIRERIEEVTPPEKKVTGITRVLHFSYTKRHPVYIDVMVTLKVENVEDIPKLEAYADQLALDWLLEQGFNLSLSTSLDVRAETQLIYDEEVEEEIEGKWRHEDERWKHGEKKLL
jgi:hypothetical protein